MQKNLIIIGLAIIIVGLSWPWISKLPIGRLPGDIVIGRSNMKIYIPITTMIVVSIILSVIMWILRR
ncbi:MAG: DUF2905 domain-containing protein [Desulfosalsimonadaceae bacterium]